MADRICGECGEAMPIKPGIAPKLCIACRRKTCPCGEVFLPGRRSQRFCSLSCALERLPSKHCGICGELFEPRGNKAQYCDSCAPKRQGAGGSDPKHRIRCEWCRRQRLVTKRSARFCSQECYRNWEARPVYGPPRPMPILPWFHPSGVTPRQRDAVLSVATILASAWKNGTTCDITVVFDGLSSPKTFYSGPCRRCGQHFTIYAQGHTSYCSRACSRADSKDRRRALEKGAGGDERVIRHRIFERDKWICQLCGKKVKRNVVGYHPKGPTIDHILPLEHGGRHEPANVQCAHHLCNGIKSAGVWGDGEQLRLVG